MHAWSLGLGSAPDAVLLERGVSGRRVDNLVARVVTALPAIQEALTAGSLVVVEPAIVRIRSLPIL